MTEHAQMFGQGGLNDGLDTDELLEDIGLDRQEIDWRKDFIDFDHDDVERLSKFEGVFKEEGDTIADLFYDNLKQYDETMEVISRSPKGVEELKQTQKAYLVTLAEGDYGMDYFRNRARIGKLHDMLDMPMKHYIGQYGVYYNLLIPLIAEEMEDRIDEKLEALTFDTASDGGVTLEEPDQTDEFTPETAKKAAKEVFREGLTDLHSVLKIINLDMQVVADTYIESYTSELEEALQRQRETAQELKSSIGELSAATDEIAEASTQISQTASENAESMEEVSGEISNLSATVEEIASSAQQVEDQSEHARTEAEKGQETATKASDQMDQLDGARVVISNRVDELEGKIDEIDEVISVINEIANQTNLLALNANIEAARAGEAGNGFAVVADEIKSLSEDTQSNADEIEGMIEDVRTAASETIRTLDRIEDGIEDGNEAVTETETRLKEITNAIDETVIGISEIADATDDQAASAEEIAAMVDEQREANRELANDIEDAAAATEEQAASINELEESAERLGS